MRQFCFAPIAALAALLSLAPGAPVRAEPAVVVELFTSQGCYSCPPADEVLGKLAEYDHIVALAMHVDYWDYLGWRDTFAQKTFTKRQFDYRDYAGARVVYTPQMIVQGTKPVTGSRAMSVKEAISQAEGRPVSTEVVIVAKDGALMGIVSPVVAGGSFVLFAASYIRQRTVEIARGENGGKRLTYHNIVDGRRSHRGQSRPCAGGCNSPQKARRCRPPPPARQWP
ncbi:MAG: DUF1223 domain-containing protein [Pseudomonadota bacterium]